MTKTLFVLLMSFVILGFQFSAQADYATTPQPMPQPGHHYGPYPYPYPPQPYPYPAPAPYYPGANYVTCYSQGLANGAYFYGVAFNIPAAQNWALQACSSSGQYCQLLGCRW